MRCQVAFSFRLQKMTPLCFNRKQIPDMCFVVFFFIPPGSTPTAPVHRTVHGRACCIATEEMRPVRRLLV
jgi:hypothetical protein